MNKLDQKRKQLDLERVKVARMDLELKIEERLEEIERLKEHIKVQLSKEAELLKDLEQNN